MTLACRADPFGRATQPTDTTSQENTRVRPSDLAARLRPALDGRELENRRMSEARRGHRDATRDERRRTEQTNDEREWEKALAGQIHDCSRLLNWMAC